ncbi:MAG: hypothetical protein MK226_05025 [Saprospiraceae bacterium]|nr:hypothetical protein [Saprospiraceae bacterium]
MKIRPFEIFLIQIVFYLILWLSDQYLAVLLSLIFGSICFFILLIASIAELVERSRISKSYFSMMIASVLAPVIIGGLMVLIFGTPEWLLEGN